VSDALALVEVDHPGQYTRAYVFHQCEQCGQINLVKDDVLECAVCASALPAGWNFERGVG
jgi:hypothetical protein